MDGPQDVGGRDGFGPVAPDPHEPLFHADWERRALGLTLACGVLGHWNIDESRHARESRHPADYYQSTYYEIWIKALITLLQRHGEMTEQELDSGQVLQPGIAVQRCLAADAVPAVLARGGSSERPLDTAARFQPGDRVRTCSTPSAGHTRLPAYARGKTAIIVSVNGAHVLPDTNAHGLGEQPQWLYTLAFDGKDLWGAAGEPGVSVNLDAWESYLEPV